jgi:hypothetical protein
MRYRGSRFVRWGRSGYLHGTDVPAGLVKVKDKNSIPRQKARPNSPSPESIISMYIL